MTESCLVEDIPSQESGPTQRTRVEIIPISKLVISKANVRKEYMHWEDLLPSIKKEGITNPLDVWYNNETKLYEIMNGQNRYLCARHLNIINIECLIYLDVTTLKESKKWCRSNTILQKDISLRDKKQITLDLKEEYGSLKAGCEAEGYSYDMLKEWARTPDEALDYDIPLRLAREISRIDDSERRATISKEVHGMTLQKGMRALEKRLDNWDQVDHPPKRLSNYVIDYYASVGNKKAYDKQLKWCKKHGFDIYGPVYENYFPRERNRKILKVIIDYLREHHPETNRRLLYVLASLKLLKKEDDNVVSILTSRGRRAGLINPDWIIDLSRRAEEVPMYDSVESYLDYILQFYRSKWWENQSSYVEVWCEKKTLIEHLLPVCRYFGVTLMPCSGWNSETHDNNGVKRFRKYYKQGKQCVMIYIGDLDPSGRRMFEEKETLFRQRVVPVMCISLMLNDMEQVENYNLNWAKKPANPKDPNYKWYVETFGTKDTVEIDALPSENTKYLLKEILLVFIDEDLLEKAKATDKESIERLKKEHGFDNL